MVSGFTSDAEAITQITHCRRHEGGRAATAQGSKTPSKQKEPRAFRLHPGSGPFHIPFPPCFTHSLEEGTRREEPGELRAGTQRLPAPPAARPPSLLSTSLRQAPPLPQAEGTAHHSPGSLAGKGAWVRPSKTKVAPVPQKSTQWYYWNK